MSVHYRFKSALEYDTITFDGLHISVKDLKNAIIQQKRIGKSTDFDLTITNAQTQEVYKDENSLIPKNTSLLIARIPLTAPKPKQWEGYGGNDTPPLTKVDDIGSIGKAVDLANLDAPEEDKIKAMMTQSTQEYDPSNYAKIRGANQFGPVPPSYRCYKCHQTGHWIKDCPLGQGVENVDIKKSTGIPHSFMVPVEGPQVPGAMMMSNGQYAVPALDYQAYSQKNPAPAATSAPKPEIPEDLLCSICSDLLTDAVMIPCCGNSFCDECIRGVLLESEDHECPDCHEKDISPATLIPNRFLRKSVANFKNNTGYEKKPVYKPKPVVVKEPEQKKEATPPPVADSTEKEHQKLEEKTVISEADSTEHTKNDTDFSKEPEMEPIKTDDVEGPPGVSPLRESPKRHIKTKVTSDRNGSHKDRDYSDKHKHKSSSPRKHRHPRSPSYESRRRSEERQGTPTRDEPPGMGTNYIPPTSTDAFNPGGLPPNMMQGPPPNNMPPGVFPPPGVQPPIGGFPPVSGPPPNFRIPPPGSQPPPFMGPGNYPVPPRPMFDPSRPPMGGPGNYGPPYGGRPRDFNRRGIRERTPPGVIDDPLAAFNRILREKDEKRARQQRLARRSWSRSRSRSRSYSRSPPPLRRRSRSPRRRSRSRSFSISRRRNDRDRNDYERDYDRGGFRGGDKPRMRRGDSRDRFYDDRDYDRGMRRGPPPQQQQQSQQPQQQWGQRDGYYPPSDQQAQQQPYQNRYPPRDYHPPHMQNVPPERKYADVAPPGIEQPPIPGLESELPPDLNRDKKTPEIREKDRDKYPREDDKDKKDKLRRREENKRSRSRTLSPEKWRNPSPKPKDETPDRSKRRRISSESKEERRRDKERTREYSDDDKKKSKEKKKHKDRKDEKRKKKDKKDKHHRRSDRKEKEKKDEFKQVIPRAKSGSEDDPEISRRKSDEKHKHKKDDTRKHPEQKELTEEEEKQLELKRQAEERKKEERRLRFIEDEKRKREEEARKEEIKRKAIEEARRLLEEEEERRKELEAQKTAELPDLYDKVIPETEIDKEVVENIPNMNVEDTEQVFDTNPEEFKEKEDGEVTDDQEPVVHKELEEEDSGILELHSDMDIRLEESDINILAPVPEKSKWEVDEDGQIQTSPKDLKDQGSDSKPAKVSNEVLKRAENVIFARAINSIRPIEIKKISGDRAKLYSDDKKEIVVEDVKVADVVVERPRLSVKDRLGVKVDDPDPRIILVENQKSSPPFTHRDRRIEVQEHRRSDRRRSKSRKREYSRERDSKRRDRSDRNADRNKRVRRDDKERSKPEDRKEKHTKKTPIRSDSEEHRRKRKEKKTKKEKEKEKPKKHEEVKEELEEQKLKLATEKRKPTLDEANFEPDYDLELHEDETSDIEKALKKEKEVKRSELDEESSSSESSSSSSEEDKRKKKRKKHRKKKKKESSSSSSSDSSEDSSDSEKERKRKKHKKNKKKKKKSKHK